MGITYNRKPAGVSVPSNSAVGQNYFNHFNWKGINQNRNFLVVDQETFADANNVYVDDEGLLKSRLPVKFRYKFEGKYLKDVKVFDNILVCTYIENDEWYIGIIDDNIFVNSIKTVADYSLKAFKNGDYLYIFTNDGCKTYNDNNKEITDTLFYAPITRVYAGLNFDFFESENLVSSKNRYQYMLFPTIGSSDEDNKYIPNSVNANAYGRTGNYVHYLNEDKINHEIFIDEDKKFLNVVHQPLFSTAEGFYVTNTYGRTAPNWVIRNENIYRAYNGKLQMANITDGIFVDLDDIAISYFVKIKLLNDGRIILINSNSYYLIDYNNDITYHHSIPYISSSDNCIDMAPYGTDNWCILYYSSSKIKFYASSNHIMLTEGVYVQTDGLSGCVSCRPDLEWFYVSYVAKNCADFVTIKLRDNSNYTLESENYVVTSDDYLRAFIRIDSAHDIPYDTFEPYAKYTDSRHRLYFNIELNSLIYSSTHYAITPANGEYYQYLNGGLIISSNDTNIYYVNRDYRMKVTSLNGKIFVNEGYWMLHLDDKSLTLSNYRLKPQAINVEVDKSNALNTFDVVIKRNKFYTSKNNNLYIGEIIIDPDDDKEKLYFKKDYEHILDEDIAGLHPISDTELAIFTKDNIWYNTSSEGVQYYIESKIVPSLKNRSELITLPDSTTTLMPSNNGIVALSYQNFVNTTEQSTVNITQDLTSIYSLFKNNIRSLNWKQYTIFYESDNDMILIYDNRLASWWRWTLPIEISCLFVYDNLLYCIANGGIYEFSNSTIDYFDLINTDKMKIDWYVESQKLYLGANNNYKHISNITLFSVQEGGDNDKLSLELNVKNYRKNVNNGKSEDFDYKIDVIRTYVKRVNYAKVCEFQYKLGSNSQSDVELDIPLALSNVSIKYKTGGQVR